MDLKYVKQLTGRDVMRRAQRERSVTQETLAGKIGIKRNALCQNMNRSRLSLSTFSDVLTALDYDIVIVDRETGEAMWKLETERPDLDDDI